MQSVDILTAWVPFLLRIVLMCISLFSWFAYLRWGMHCARSIQSPLRDYFYLLVRNKKLTIFIYGIVFWYVFVVFVIRLMPSNFFTPNGLWVYRLEKNYTVYLMNCKIYLQMCLTMEKVHLCVGCCKSILRPKNNAYFISY